MPTGYTAKLYEDKPQTFEEFLFSCARAFGALVMLRDEPNAPSPEEFKPETTYYDGQIARGRETLERLATMTPKEAKVEAEREYQEALVARDERHATRTAMRKRYADMLGKVYAWTPPTEEHVGLRDFMIQQLTDSIEHDTNLDDKYYPLPSRDGAGWIIKQRQNAEHDIAYGEEHRAEEIERTATRNAWIKALRESVA